MGCFGIDSGGEVFAKVSFSFNKISAKKKSRTFVSQHRMYERFHEKGFAQVLLRRQLCYIYQWFIICVTQEMAELETSLCLIPF